MRPARWLVYAAAGTAAYGLTRALLTRQKLWASSYGPEGFGVSVSEVPLWSVLLQEALQYTTPCMCNAPEWAYRVGPRRFGVYDDGSNDPLHSLGSLMRKVCEIRVSITDRNGTRPRTVPVARALMREIDRAWVTECDEVFDADGREKVVAGQVVRDESPDHVA